MSQSRRALPDSEGDGRATPVARGETAFRNHLVTYLVTGAFLVTLNLLTSPRSLWFYWPLFFWGWALVFQAVKTFGADAPARVIAILRSLIPGAAAPPARLVAAPPAAPAAEPAATLEAVEERVKRLWRIARQIPEGPVRDQAFRISAAADRVAEVMAADRTDPRTIGWFSAELLEPAEDLLVRYTRLRSRGIASADETLRRVEERNLPALEARIDALYDQLHRGDVVDLAVASEMLDFELPDRPPLGREAGGGSRE